VIPLNDEGIIKFNYELSFTNKEPHPESGQLISCPPDSVAACTWCSDVPEILKADAQKIIRGTYGSIADELEIESYRICW
jgi:sarcosine oxidase/L-pipecolate oxidase